MKALKIAGLCGAALSIIAGACVVFQMVATMVDDLRFPPPGKLVEVDGTRLHIDCSGRGTPSVVLDAGHGSYSLDWTLVQTEVSRFTLACAYDRAGMGWSEPSPKPRSAGNLAIELHTLLRASGVTPPIVLVGHSLAGFTVRLYANYFSSEVAGIVLVDSSVESGFDMPDFNRFFASRLAKFKRCRWQAPFGLMRIASFFSLPGEPAPLSKLPPSVQEEYEANRYRACRCTTIYREFAAIPASVKELRRDGYSLDSIPLVVIRHGQYFDSPADEESFRRAQDRLARLSSVSTELIAERSGHMIPLEQPEIVVRAIRQLVDQARGGQP